MIRFNEIELIKINEKLVNSKRKGKENKNKTNCIRDTAPS